MQRFWTTREISDRRGARSLVLAYLTPIALVVAAGLFWIWVHSEFDRRVSFFFLVPPLILSAAVGGRLAGIIATGLGLILGIAFVSTDGFDLDDAIISAGYASLGAISVLANHRLHAMRRAAEISAREVQDRETHLQSIVDTLPEAMIVIDELGIMQSFSVTAERLFGHPAADVIGKNVKMLMPSPYQEQHDNYLSRYRATGERHIVGIGRVVVGRRKDGSTFPMELSVGEMRSLRGRFFTAFIRDLTERQETQARLQELQSELVHISRLTSMGEMASTLAHELNQPLSAISNYLKGSRHLLDSETLDRSRLGDALARAGDQAVRAGQIIRRLRDFVARGETERRLESLPKLIEEASALALVGAKEHGIQVRFDLDPEVDFVLVDRVQIQQVLVNLMRNAIDAMEDIPRRELTIRTAPADGNMAEVSVADTGPGIDKDVAEQLFQPFITTKRQGMGVGLSISRTIIEAHGGRIWVSSTSDSGATFQFLLPRVGKDEVSYD